jgi:hypothetical protein
MGAYALLILPSANRANAEASVALTQAELEVFNRSVLGARLSDVSATTIGGVPYVTFAADRIDRPAVQSGPGSHRCPFRTRRRCRCGS